MERGWLVNLFDAALLLIGDCAIGNLTSFLNHSSCCTKLRIPSQAQRVKFLNYCKYIFWSLIPAGKRPDWLTYSQIDAALLLIGNCGIGNLTSFLNHSSCWNWESSLERKGLNFWNSLCLNIIFRFLIPDGKKSDWLMIGRERLFLLFLPCYLYSIWL